MQVRGCMGAWAHGRVGALGRGCVRAQALPHLFTKAQLNNTTLISDLSANATDRQQTQIGPSCRGTTNNYTYWGAWASMRSRHGSLLSLCARSAAERACSTAKLASGTPGPGQAPPPAAASCGAPAAQPPQTSSGPPAVRRPTLNT